MSLDLEGKKCAVCHSYLFDDDDVVYCPQCGAPHHKDCYKALGHCALESLHGTEKQYDASKESKEKKEEIKIAYHTPSEEEQETNTVICGMCGEEYDKNQRVCPECNSPNFSAFGGKFSDFDFLGGVPADMDLGDGITADEAKRFVSSNTHRYIPKFAQMTIGKKASWNWIAFIFPCGWFLSRKMYKKGLLIGALSIALTLINFPFSKALNYIDMSSVRNYSQMFDIIMQNLPKIGTAALIAAMISGILNIVLRVVCAVIGDYSYKNYTISSIKEIKSNSEDIEDDFHRKGGVSLISLILGIMAVQYLPAVLSMFV